jgi:hypothetical protein
MCPDLGRGMPKASVRIKASHAEPLEIRSLALARIVLPLREHVIPS